MSTRNNASFSDIAAAVRAASRIGVVCHVRPDGDAIGSLLGLARSLELAGKSVLRFSEDGVPGNLAFLPGTELVLKPGSDPIMDLDLAIALDTAVQDRIGEGCTFVLSGASKWINIDHHSSNPGYGDLSYVDEHSPATGQVIYEWLADQGFPIDDVVRQNLFAAISTDTGSFQYSSTNPTTHRIVAEMMEAGLDTSRLAQLLYDTYPKRRLDLMRAMLNEMRFRSNERIVSWLLTRETRALTGMQPGDTEGLIDILRMVDTVVAAVVFDEQKDGSIRVSARSKSSSLNVAQVCAAFGGGGHRLAAGARLEGPSIEAVEKFLQALENEVERTA